MPRRTQPRGRSRAARRAQRPKDVLHGPGGHRADAFRCLHCRLEVSLTAPGTSHRNHCPHCLTSRHVDGRVPGDRSSGCRGRMEALTLCARADGEWLLVHACRACGELSANRIAGDDNALALVRLALRPLQDAGLAGRVAAL